MKKQDKDLKVLEMEPDVFTAWMMEEIEPTFDRLRLQLLVNVCHGLLLKELEGELDAAFTLVWHELVLAAALKNGGKVERWLDQTMNETMNEAMGFDRILSLLKDELVCLV